MVPRFACRAGALAVGLLLCLPAASNAADSGQLRSKGKTLLQANCGRCHAIGAVGRSRLKGATPMRDIYARFAPRELQAELREGMVSRHRAMPQAQTVSRRVMAWWRSNGICMSIPKPSR